MLCGLVLALGLAAPADLCAASWWPTGLAGTVGAWLKSNWNKSNWKQKAFVAVIGTIAVLGVRSWAKQLEEIYCFLVLPHRPGNVFRDPNDRDYINVQMKEVCSEILLNEFFMDACQQGYFDEALALLARIKKIGFGGGTSHLFWACKGGYAEIVRLLIARGIPTDDEGLFSKYKKIIGMDTETWQILGTFYTDKKAFATSIKRANGLGLKALIADAAKYQCTDAEKELKVELARRKEVVGLMVRQMSLSNKKLTLESKNQLRVLPEEITKKIFSYRPRYAGLEKNN
jgi:hypothetical protein